MKKIISVFALSVILLPAVSFAATFNQNLSYGSAGVEVTQLQTFLMQQGLYTGPITGNFFNLTKNAVIVLQKQKGLTQSGFFGPLTRSVVNAWLMTYSQATSTAPISTVQPMTTPTAPTTSQTIGLSLPPATATQLAGINYLCAYVETQGASTTAATACASGTVLTGYNSNAIFRSNIDLLIQALEQKEAAQQGAYSNAQVQAFQEYTNFLNSQQQNNNEQKVVNELQQLQNTLNENNSLLSQQYWQQELQQETAPFQTTQTHCAIEAGVWTCNLPGAQ